MRLAGQRLFVVGPSWVGDMVMAQSLFKLLALCRDEVVIDVLAPAWAEPVLQRMPEVRRSLHMPIGHGSLQLRQRRQLGASLRPERYDQALVLPNSLKSALIPWFADIPIRTGWLGEMRYGLLNDLRRLDKLRYPRMVQRFAALAFEPELELPAQLPAPSLQVDAANQRLQAERLGLSSGRPVLGLCPGAEFGSSKRWPANHYATLACEYLEQGWQVLLLGSVNDSPAAEAIVAAIPVELRGRCRDGTGNTSLVDAIDLLALCRAVVSNDSGLMHVAGAVDTALVAIYGSSSPSFTPPLGNRVATTFIDLDCRPCFKRECPLGHLNCLVQLEPERVGSALRGLLGSEARG